MLKVEEPIDCDLGNCAEWENLNIKWNELRKSLLNSWVRIEALESELKESRWAILEISVINCYDGGSKALKGYSEKHKNDKTREIYVYHKNHEELII